VYLERASYSVGNQAATHGAALRIGLRHQNALGSKGCTRTGGGSLKCNRSPRNRQILLVSHLDHGGPRRVGPDIVDGALALDDSDIQTILVGRDHR